MPRPCHQQGGAAPVAGIESKNRSAPRSQNKRPNRIFSSVCKLGSQKMFLRRVLVSADFSKGSVGATPSSHNS